MASDCSSILISGARSVAGVGGTVLLVAAAAAAVMTGALVLMVLAVGGGAVAVTAATGVGLLDTIAESEWDAHGDAPAK